ncbi:MAG TPA: tRNA (guanosine(37)-N1)-methyltransferase TrmD [Acidobacteriaceae bacterium]|nr:tRNA (guanosine(37)-N1)-methyltransferase TrmD [Acidobacteriaceae bacterium]
MRFDLITLFPGFFEGPLHYGVLERALRSGLAEVHTHDLRQWTHDHHRTVDDRPFGGGEGMVLKPQPIFDCAESLHVSPKDRRDSTRESVILLSAQGRRFTQSTARRLATLDRIVLICGRYEGVDERVAELLADQELSIGDFVLSGCELAAAAVIDAVTRLLPGVLGHEDSSRYESFGLGDEVLDSPQGRERGIQNSTCHPEDPEHREGDEGPASLQDRQPHPGLPRSTHGSGGLLDYPHYTRPATFRGAAIPDVLQNGDHAAIRRWRRHAALAKTFANRPDLLTEANLSDDDREFLAGLQSQSSI